MNDQRDSVLASPAEAAVTLQSWDGVRLDEAHLLMNALMLEAEAPRLQATNHLSSLGPPLFPLISSPLPTPPHSIFQVVSGRHQVEIWDEVPASRLDPMFKTFRSVLAHELGQRFLLKGTPNEHVLLALKMSPFIDTGPRLLLTTCYYLLTCY